MTPYSARTCSQASVSETPCGADRPSARRLRFAVAAGLSALVLTACANRWPFKAAEGADPAPVTTATPTAPAAGASAPAPAAAAAPQPEVMAQPVAPSPRPEPAPLAQPAPEPAAAMKPAPAQAPAAAPASATLKHGAYYINVGLFMVPANGINAHQKLEAAGLPVFSDTVQSAKKGPLTRVRVGPFASKAQAQAAAQKIKTLKLEAAVFRH